MSQRHTLEPQQSPSAAFRNSTMEPSKLTKKSRSDSPAPFEIKRSTHSAHRAQKVLPADVKLKVSDDGTAMVIDRRLVSFPGRQQDKKRRDASRKHYPKCNSRIGLAQKLRWLALGLERESCHDVKDLLREVDVCVEELRDRVRRAEQKALTVGFYGYPPRVMVE